MIKLITNKFVENEILYKKDLYKFLSKTVRLIDIDKFIEQHNWPREFKDCGGKYQSPIELSPSKSIILPLPSLELLGYHNYLPRLTIANNGHSGNFYFIYFKIIFRVNFKNVINFCLVALEVDNNNLKLNRKLPYIFGATLEDNEGYEFSGLHFHWGLKNNHGSEHVVNGIRY